MQNNKLYSINSDFDINFLVASMPGYVYWKDLNSVYFGCNNNFAIVSNLKSPYEIIGKTDHDFSWGELDADGFIKEDKFVIETGQTHISERILPINNELQVFRTEKKPLIGKSGRIIGVLGNAVNITKEREAEQLKLKNEVNETQLKEQEKFKKVIGQIAHDIQSPLSSLQTIVQAAIDIPENDRVTLRGVAMSITDITTYMLNTYQNKFNPESEQKQPWLLSANLLQVLSEKRYEYKDIVVEFRHDFDKDSYFTFIKIEPSSFKRMVSNVINNAVDALKHKKDGKVIVKLNLTNEWVVVSIKDNGKGISQETLDNIMNNIPVTNKNDGHGIGLTQIKDTLQDNYGKLVIDSILDVGTTIQLKFPKIVAPTWIVQEIKVYKDDIIVILDDESSIHGAWDIRLATIINDSNIQVKHFFDGMEAINFINSFTKIEKQKICLLADYELLNQSVNGLDVIKQTQVKRSILVTSYSMNSKIRREASKGNVKILPKSLVFAVPINLSTAILPQSRKVDMVWVDDAKELIDSFIDHYYKDLTIDKYYDPLLFLDNYLQYSLDTRIILDFLYYDDIIFIKDGLTIAKELYENGYTNLFMATAEIVPQDKIPNYLTVILKNDLANMSKLDKLQKPLV